MEQSFGADHQNLPSPYWLQQQQLLQQQHELLQQQQHLTAADITKTHSIDAVVERVRHLAANINELTHVVGYFIVYEMYMGLYSTKFYNQKHKI